MRFTIRRGALRRAMRFRTTFFTRTLPDQVLLGCAYADRGAASDTCIAPPPITAPPQAQAQSFARAIRTDITNFLLFDLLIRPIRNEAVRPLWIATTLNGGMAATQLTLNHSRFRLCQLRFVERQW
jgi:hypothetical protein